MKWFNYFEVLSKKGTRDLEENNNRHVLWPGHKICIYVWLKYLIWSCVNGWSPTLKPPKPVYIIYNHIFTYLFLLLLTDCIFFNKKKSN